MQDNHELKFKERTPEETVNRIMDFFSQIGVEVEEEWIAENEIGTHSLRLSLKGAPAIGSNGKGITKRYARASAYAEFMERLQNMRMSQISTIVRIHERKGGFIFHPGEKYLSAEELTEDNNAFIQNFFRIRNMQDAGRKEKANELLKVQSFDFYILKEYDKFICVPFYSVKEDRVCYIPYLLSSVCYASNGMCAGNSPCEALVQGISEIFERNANNRVLGELTSLPDFPESKIACYPEVYRMYRALAESDRYKVQIKDASYGGMFPVVGIVLIERNTGRFGVKFGAHPDVGIALERIFTEATQGITLAEFSHKSELSFLNEQVGSENNLINSFRTSNAQYPYQMLLKPAQYPYYDFPMVNSLSNRDLLKGELEKVLSHGYDVMIMDCSYSGFCSYHVVIPGLSEVGKNDNDAINLAFEVFNMQYAFAHPACLNEQLCRKLIKHLSMASGKVLENTIHNFSGIYSDYPYPGKAEYVDIYYAIVICALKIQEYSTASEAAHFMIKTAHIFEQEITTDLIMLEKYADGMLTLGDHAKVIEYMRYIFDDKLCDEYDERFSVREEIVQKIYPEIWLDNEYCPQFRHYEDLIARFKAFAKEHTVDPGEIREVVKSLYLEEKSYGTVENG